MDKNLEFYSQLLKEDSPDERFSSLWDLVVITAINERQKRCYECQIARKRACKQLPASFTFLVVADPDNVKIGSGGSTFNVAKRLHQIYGARLFTMKVLLIHAGGYSQRMVLLELNFLFKNCIICDKKPKSKKILNLAHLHCSWQDF